MYILEGCVNLEYKNFKLVTFFLFIIGFSLGAIFYGSINVVRGSDVLVQNESLVNENESSNLFSRSKSIADVVEEVSPGVVTVSVSSIVNSYRGVNEVSGIGTGFFISPTKILTNQHVVLNSSNVKIVLNDGKEVEARVVNTDQVNDIALLEVTTPGFENSTVLKMGSSEEIRVGDWVIAIGSPLDLSFSGSATVGIISGLSRTFETRYGVSTFIQTDAAINPGNSGGPLLNLNGEVIGINTAKIDVDGVESIGFAIPINFAELKLEELSQYVINLGIAGVDIDEQTFVRFGVPTGVFVVEVERDSIAHKIGIIPGDIIVNFNGVEINSIEQINELKKKVEDQISIDIIRNGKIMKLNLKI